MAELKVPEITLGLLGVILLLVTHSYKKSWHHEKSSYGQSS